MSDRQFLFDKVVYALREQGEKSVQPKLNRHGNQVCVYRGGGKCGTLKCGVGHLIADEFYDPEMENEIASSILVYNAVGDSLGFKLSEYDARMLNELQEVHDNLDVVGWEHGFKNVADKNAIEYEAPK